jgi:predicted nucleic acid-binding protein
MRLLVDTNVLLDVLGRREPFWPQAARVWTMAETGRLRACVSAISYNNTYYIVRRWGGRARAEDALRLLRDVFDSVDLTQKILNQAMDAELSDFEDAIQYFSAVHAGADAIITRNPGDFPRAGPPVLTPGEFLATHFDKDR